MCYCHRKDCGWNATHTSRFHAAWKSDYGTFVLTSDHDYWKLSRKTICVATGTGSSEVSGVGTQAQRRLDLYEANLLHQGDATDATFSSFLTEFSNVMDNLK